MDVKIQCEAADTLPLDTLTAFQGDLKKLTRQNANKLKNNIINNGFIAPIFIWKTKTKNYLLDGHQRLKVLEELQDEGYGIPDLPVAFIQARSKKDAKQKLLGIASQYGEFDIKGLDIFIEELNIEALQSTVRITNSEIELMEPNFGPVGEDEQSKLDEKAPTVCPECGHEFTT